MQGSDTGVPTQSVWLKSAWQASNYLHAWDVFWEKGEGGSLQGGGKGWGGTI